MSTFYIDGGAGVAGDMFLGAWIGLGLSPAELERTLKRALRVSAWKLEVRAAERRYWPAWSVTVEGDRPFGGPEKMKAAVRRSSLPLEVKQRATQIFDALAWAERQAHGKARAAFEPHGLGLFDTLVDVVGNAWALWRLKARSVCASAVCVGRLAPASSHLIRRYKIPVQGEAFAHELATPTGLAILGEIVSRFGAMPASQLESSGYGAGRLTWERPNVLAIHQIREPSTVGIPERVVQLETLIDDMDPRLYPYVADLLFKQGALDVWWISVGMKKGRPGMSFCALCRPDDERRLLETLFRETTTLGVRRLPVERRTLKRAQRGTYKVAYLPGGAAKRQSEFERAKRISEKKGRPLRELL